MKITDLKPALVWEIFDEITKVPRPTHHLDKMKEFLVDWAKRHNIEVHTDEGQRDDACAGNSRS